MVGLIDLEKKVEISLAKKNLINEMAQISIVLDISISMRHLFNSGIIQHALERFLALGMKMDFDKKIDVFLFGTNAHQAVSCTPQNYKNFADKEILGRFRLEDSTRYAPVMQKVVENYLGYFDNNVTTETITQPKKGFFGKLFGLTEEVTVEKRIPFEPKDPSLVFFITDGDNHDRQETIRVINKASDKPIFWQYLGIGDSDFSFLRQLDEMEGRYIDNANFQQINDLQKISDEELYDRILSEYPSWLTLARSKGIIK